MSITSPVPSTQEDPDYNAAIAAALKCLGVNDGEFFEVAAKADHGFPAQQCEARTPWNVEAFVRKYDGKCNLYFMLNPVLVNATRPNGRSGDKDVAVVRVLLIDVDPEEEAGELGQGAAAEIADAIVVLLRNKCGFRVVVIDSGRGRQIWLLHEPLPVGDPRLEVRRRLLKGLAKRYDRPGLAKVDVAVHNPSRLGRLPGTVNTKTGRRAAILDRGDGGVASLEVIEKVADELLPLRPPTADPVADPSAGEARGVRHDPWIDLPPIAMPRATAPPEVAVPPAPPRPAQVPTHGALQGFRDAVRGLRLEPDVWRWIGAVAARFSQYEHVLPSVAPTVAEAFGQGVTILRAGGKVTCSLDQKEKQRITRALQALAAPPPEDGDETGPAALQIVSLTRRTLGEGRRAWFDLSVATPRAGADIAGLTSGELRDYEVVSQRAMEQGLPLPALGKQAKRVWLRLLERSWDDARVEPTVREEDLDSLLEAEIKAFLRDAEDCATAEEVKGGGRLRRDGAILVSGDSIVRQARGKYGDDGATRLQIVAAARRLEFVEKRVAIGTVRLRVWAFPDALLSGEE